VFQSSFPVIFCESEDEVPICLSDDLKMRMIRKVFFVETIVDLFQKKTSWYATAVFSVLAVAFLVTSFQGGSWRFFQPVVISMGKKSIRLDEFQRLLAQKQAMNRLMGRFTPKEILMRLFVDDQLLSIEMEKMGIDISQKSAIESLKKNRFFFNKKGEFSEKNLQTFLRESGISLKQLIEEERKRIAIRYLKEALLAQISLPSDLVKLMSEGIFQERSGGYRSFPLIQGKTPTASPSEKDLQDLFQSLKEVVAPPVRSYQILRLSPTLWQKTIQVSDQEIRQYHTLYMASTPLEASRQEIVKKLKAKKAQEKMEKLIVKVEDGLGAGKTLKQIAEQEQLPLYQVTTDRQGQMQDGEKSPLLSFEELGPEAKAFQVELLDKIFQLPVGQDPDLLSFPQGENLFIQVSKSLPEKKLSYTEALPRLKILWEKEFFKKSLLKEAEDFRKKKGKTGMTPCVSMTLNSKNEDVPTVVKEALFSLELNGSRIVSDDKALYVVELNKIVPPQLDALSKKEKADLKSIALQEIRRICWECYLQSLRRSYPLGINAEKLEKIFQSTESP
jgi:hypothetical protein